MSDPSCLTCACSAGMSRPRSSCTAPEMSETAITRAPRSWSSLAATPPTLPKPWTTHAFPASSQPPRQRRALAERDLGVVAEAALRRPEHGRVLDAVTREDLDRAVVAPKGDADDHRALGIAEPLGDHVRDVCVRQRLLELGLRHAE